MSEQEHVVDLLPGYALGSLDDDEKQAVTRHLSGCDDCRAELLAFQAVTDQLGFAAPARTPPPALKARVMEKVLAQRRAAPPAQERRGWAEMFRFLSIAWSLASLVIVTGLVVSNLALARQVRELRAIANPTNFRTLALAGTEAVPEASGIIVISPDGRYGTVIVEQLPPLDEAHQYQLWLIKDGERTSGGVFSVGRAGYGSMYVRSPEPLVSYTGFGVTVEPAGGSPGPTGEKVLGSVEK